MKELPNKTYFLAGCVGIGILLLAMGTHREILKTGFGPQSDPRLDLLLAQRSLVTGALSQQENEHRFAVLDRLWMLSPIELLLVASNESVERTSHDLPALYSRAASPQSPSRAFLSLDEIDLARRWAVLLAAGHTATLQAVLDAGSSRGLPSGLKVESCRWIEIEALYRRSQVSDPRSLRTLLLQLKRCPQAKLHQYWLEASIMDLANPKSRKSLLDIVEGLKSWAMDPKQNEASRNLAHLMRKSLELRFH
jgi:hypothetical protein